MWQAVRENPRAVMYAVLMHVGLLLLLVFSLDWTPDAVKPGTNKPIQAELVDMTRVREMEAQKKAEQQRIEDQKRKQEQEKQRQAEAAAQQKSGSGKTAQGSRHNARKRPSRKSSARPRPNARRRPSRSSSARPKPNASKRPSRRKQRKAEAERNKKAEQEKQRKAEALRQQQAEQALQAQLAEEAAQARAESALSQFIPYIQQKVQNSWRRPAGSPPGLSCVIQVKLIPGGEVVSAKVVQSSGDALFDRSVETAVLKASPLPLPDDPAMFKYFREINFRFVPD